MIALLVLSALAADLRPVRLGDTVESLADGDSARAARIRELNGLAPGAQPAIGTIVEIPPPDGDHGEQQAFLVALTGDATFTPGGRAAEPAVAWQPIEAGTLVCTGGGAFATLRLASTCNEDGSASDDILLQSETCVAVDAAFSATERRSTLVRLTRGSVNVQAAPTAEGHVTIVTPSGITTGTRGGYRVTVEDAAARTEALLAPAAVQGAGKEVALQPGQGSRVKTGEAPSDPVDLLVTKTLGKPGPGEPLRRPEFSWTPVPGALGYRLEIAKDLWFRDLIFQEDVPDPTWVAPVLMLPYGGRTTLHWRVASFDRLGFLGRPTPSRALRVPEVPADP